jgi:ribulose-phosphate 3-epimerase
MTARVAPSMLAADVLRLADAARVVEAAGASLLHIDAMDGHFVPNLGLGPDVVAALRRVTALPLDVHLMISDPDRYLERFIEAGASMVTVHAEATRHLDRTLTRIRELGARAGVALNPATTVTAIDDVLDRLDHVLVMSVNPGFSAQKFIPHSLRKIGAVRARLDKAGRAVDIEVDGGVDVENAGALVRAGATILVAGTAVFASPDPARAIATLLAATEGGVRV